LENPIKQRTSIPGVGISGGITLPYQLDVATLVEGIKEEEGGF
jgi:hypothetical protein